jgi:outer membrane protein assembly factor BamB
MKALCLVGLVLIFGAVAAKEVPMFRGNPEHTGVYGSVGVPQFKKVKWKFHADGALVSSAAVANDTVYIGSNDHHLYAIDVESGAVRWKFDAAGRVTSSPAVSGGVVYFGSYDGNFYAVDAAKGQLKWKFHTAGERRFAARHIHGAEPSGETMPDPFDCYLSSPVVVGNRVYFGSGDGSVYALDTASGKPAWTFHTGDVVHASPAVSDGTVYVGSWDSYFYAIDATTGKEKWRFKTGEDHDIFNQVGIQSSPAVADGVVYFGCRDSNFYALDARSGLKKWVFNNSGSWVITSPAIEGGKVYFATSDSSLFYALDAKSGAVQFSLKFKWPFFSSPAIAGKTLYIGSNEGKLVAIDLASQKVAWTFQTEGSARNGPAYTKPDGSPNYEVAFTDSFYDQMVAGVTRMHTVGTILSSPVIAQNVVLVGSTDGNLYALQ